MASINDLLVSERATLREAMKTIEEGGQGIAFVCDKRRKVIGTLSDGDVRRALLRSAELDARCVKDAMQSSFSSVGPRVSRNEVLDLMRAREILQVPVLDRGGRLVGLHTLREMLGRASRENWAVIMAGGKGARLHPLTEAIPKPMIRVAGRPILERLVLHVTSFGIERIFISVNYLSHVIENHFGDGRDFGCRIEYLRETEPLGTGGSLSLLPERPKAPVLVMNGDLVTEVDVAHMLDFHEKGKFAATFGVRPHRIEIPFGVADVKGRRLVGLREKPTEQMLINAGVYIFSPEALRLVPKRNYPITDLFATLLKKEKPVGACLIRDDWTDVGRHEELRKARGET